MPNDRIQTFASELALYCIFCVRGQEEGWVAMQIFCFKCQQKKTQIWHLATQISVAGGGSYTLDYRPLSTWSSR